MRALFVMVQDVATDETKAATLRDVQTTLRYLREMTKHAEHAMHTVVLSCTRTQANACGIAGEQSRPPLRQAHRVLRMKRIGYASTLAKRGEKFS
jgi:hypothetical protein